MFMKNNIIGFLVVTLFAVAAISPLYIISFLLQKINKEKVTKLKLLYIAGIALVLLLWLPWIFFSGFILLSLLCTLSGHSSCVML